MVQVRNAVHRDFDGNGDLLLHLFGGAAGPLRDDLNVVVGDIGIGFDREIVKGDRAPDEQKRRQGQHDKTVVERGIYQCANHETFSSVISREMPGIDFVEKVVIARSYSAIPTRW